MLQQVRGSRRRPTTAAHYMDVGMRRIEWATLAIVGLGTTFVLALAVSTMVGGV
jgi:hypothetical protein